MNASPAALPTLVIGGYLGAGKTTLVNHLLRHAGGRRIAVLVNDFGELSIDADLIEGSDGAVLSLAGGCICCSFGADLVGSLRQLGQRLPRPDIVLIETSGVGLPGAVARTAALAPGVRIEGIVGVFDASAVRAQASDRYVGDTVRQQLADADLLLLNKADLLDEVVLKSLRIWLAGLHPATPVVAAVAAQLAPEVVLGLQAGDALPRESGAPRTRPIGARAAAADLFEFDSQRFEGPVDLQALVQRLADPTTRVLRAKGFLRGIDGAEVLLQGVGRRFELSAAPAGLRRAALGTLVLIRLRAARC